MIWDSNLWAFRDDRLLIHLNSPGYKRNSFSSNQEVKNRESKEIVDTTPCIATMTVAFLTALVQQELFQSRWPTSLLWEAGSYGQKDKMQDHKITQICVLWNGQVKCPTGTSSLTHCANMHLTGAQANASWLGKWMCNADELARCLHQIPRLAENTQKSCFCFTDETQPPWSTQLCTRFQVPSDEQENLEAHLEFLMTNRSCAQPIYFASNSMHVYTHVLLRWGFEQSSGLVPLKAGSHF